MTARTTVLTLTLVALLSHGVFAQRGAIAPGFGAPPPAASPFAPNGPAPRTNPSPRLNQTLPDPFVNRVPNPIMRPAEQRGLRQPGFGGVRQPGFGGRPARPNDVFRATRGTYGRLSALRGSNYGSFYGGYPLVEGYAAYAPGVQDDPFPLRQGRLNLYVSPASTQVFVDGFYAGTVGDFQDRGMWLETGPRRIELRSDGNDGVTFDVRILEDQTIDYRRDLGRATAQPEAPRVAAMPKTFYVIPGCYAGDSPPRTARLPKGCSPLNVRTVPPVVSRLTPR